METPVAIVVRQLIRDYLAGWRQFSDSVQLAGASGTDRQVQVPTSSISPVPPAAEKNTSGDENQAPSKMNHYPDWSETVTDLVTTDTPSQDLEPKRKKAPHAFELLPFLAQHEEFLLRKARVEEDQAWIELYKKRLNEISGGAESFTLDGREVATYKRNGNLNTKRLESEHPEIISRFTKLVTELKFDKDAFKEEEPELFAEYRAKVFLLPGARGIKTL